MNNLKLEERTLRDYFATQALKSLLITSPVMLGEDTSDEMLARRAEMAYRVADSMLKARER